jgi:hypothetical protein
MMPHGVPLHAALKHRENAREDTHAIGLIQRREFVYDIARHAWPVF